MSEREPLIPKHGGYRKLKGFQMAQLAYDVTVLFVEKYVDRISTGLQDGPDEETLLNDPDDLVYPVKMKTGRMGNENNRTIQATRFFYSASD